MEATSSVAQIHCHNAPKFVIPRSEATWESRGKMVDNRKAIGEKRNCLHEIATAPLGPRNDKPEGLYAR